jgi:hypothetical protein
MANALAMPTDPQPTIDTFDVVVGTTGQTSCRSFLEEYSLVAMAEAGIQILVPVNDLGEIASNHRHVLSNTGMRFLYEYISSKISCSDSWTRFT